MDIGAQPPDAESTSLFGGTIFTVFYCKFIIVSITYLCS